MEAEDSAEGHVGREESGDVGDNEDMKTEILKEMTNGNEILRKEIQLFETFLQRLNPSLLAAVEEEEPKKGKKVVKKGRGGPGEAGKRERLLTQEEKLEVATSEIEILTSEIEKVKQEGERLLDEIRSEMEETEVRMAETKKDTYEFKRDIVVGAESSRTGRTVAEKMTRYLEEKLRAKDTMIEKLRLKNATLKTQISKMEQQLNQKEEMGEVLHVVDFDQLKIENQQYLERIEERNNELLRLKLTTGKTVQVLNSVKKKLSTLGAQSTWLRRETAERREQLAKFGEDVRKVREEKAAAEKQYKLLKQEQEDTDLPEVLDYVKLKAEVSTMEKKDMDWTRKVEISEMEIKRTQRQVRTMQRTMGK
eukprot:jgi/Mesvir1/809/Mv17399-RA.1